MGKLVTTVLWGEFGNQAKPGLSVRAITEILLPDPTYICRPEEGSKYLHSFPIKIPTNSKETDSDNDG